MALISRFEFKPVCFDSSCPQTVIGTHNTRMASECHDSLSLISGEIFKIQKAEIIFSHGPEHIEVMRLFFGNMSEEKICLPGNKCPFIDLFYTQKDIAVPEIFF
jgi:hypothetical protein